MVYRLLLLPLFLLPLFTLPCAAQQKGHESVTYSAFIQASRIVEASLKAHGGLKNLQAIRNISLEYGGDRIMINQSRTAYPPWDKEPSTGKVIADLEHNRMYSYSSNSYPGIGAFAGVNVVIADSGFHYEPEKNYMGDELMKLSGNGIYSPWNYCKRWLPPLLLLQMYEDRTQLRYLGKFVKNGATLQVISYTQPKGYMMSVYFDARTHYLRGFESVRNDGVYGDLSDQGLYDNYQNFDGIMLPVKRTDYFNNAIARELTMKISVNSTVDEKAFAHPAGFRQATDDTAYRRIKDIGGGLYIDQDMGGILFVAFDKFAAVLDCPGDFDMSYSTIKEIRKTLPGKEIKYVIPSHTHGDHGGGARAYYYTGSTLVTTPGHKKFYESLARIPQTISPDSLTLFPKPPVIETFTDKKVISDGTQTLVLYNAGPNDHSKELTFAWLPRQKIIWQTDIFFVPAAGDKINKAMPVAVEFAKKLKALGIDQFEYIIDAHNSRLVPRAYFVQSLKLAGYDF